MPLIPKYAGKARAITIPMKVYERVRKFAQREEFTLSSVVATAVEEFLADRDDHDEEPVTANGEARS